MKKLILLVLVGQNLVAAKGSMDLVTEQETTAVDLKMEITELKKNSEDLRLEITEKDKTSEHLRMKITELEKTTGDLRMEITEQEKTTADLRIEITEKDKIAADLRMEMIELDKSAGACRVEMENPTAFNRMWRQTDDQKTQILPDAVAAFVNKLTADDTGLQDAGQKTFKLKYCKKIIKGSADKILRHVLVESLEAMDVFGGVARCGKVGGVRVGKQCLQFSNSTDLRNWDDAEDACKKNNGQLASITDHQTFQDYMTTHYENKMFWVGGSKASNEGKWTWLNNQQLNDDQVMPSSDSNGGGGKHCLATWWGDQYLDNSCTLPERYICELCNSLEYDTTFGSCVLNDIPRIMKKIKKFMKYTEAGLQGACWGWVGIFLLGFADSGLAPDTCVPLA